jgi:chorismate lyase/3-hydroxybenzoate synthase
MTARPYNPTRADAIRPIDAEWDLRAPAWAEALVAGGTGEPLSLDARLSVAVRSTADHALVSVRARNVDDLSPADVERATADAYTAIAERLSAQRAGHPVRFWNYIPDIHHPSGTGPGGEPLDRYMAFNAGRHTACAAWLGGEDAFPRLLATASGVGHSGTDLVVHALAASSPGVAVENPRQVPAYKYSRRYGPKPPCFARATVVAAPEGRRLVLVGGTASVRGEASVHVGDLAAQFDETIENLVALLRAASDPAATADAFASVRVYYVRAGDVAALAAASERAFGRAIVEYVRADLCRQDLLVEIEGVATI